MLPRTEGERRSRRPKAAAKAGTPKAGGAQADGQAAAKQPTKPVAAKAASGEGRATKVAPRDDALARRVDRPERLSPLPGRR